MKRGTHQTNSRVAASKGVAFSKSPVLAVRPPDWRSRLVLIVLFLPKGIWDPARIRQWFGRQRSAA